MQSEKKTVASQRFIAICLLVAVLVIDFYLIKNGTKEIPAFLRDGAADYFSGSFLDYLGLVICNIPWLLFSITVLRQDEFHEWGQRVTPMVLGGTIVCTVLGIVLISVT